MLGTGRGAWGKLSDARPGPDSGVQRRTTQRPNRSTQTTVGAEDRMKNDNMYILANGVGMVPDWQVTEGGGERTVWRWRKFVPGPRNRDLRLGNGGCACGRRR